MRSGRLAGDPDPDLSQRDNRGDPLRLSFLCGEAEVRALSRSIRFGSSCKHRLKRSDYRRIELGFDGLSKAKTGDSTRHRVTVRPVRCHRIVCVGDGDNPREDWDVFALEAIGVAEAVHAFMMVADGPSNIRIIFDLREDPLANHWVLLHLATLLERQCAAFLKESRCQPHLADVVHEPAQMNELLLFLR